MDNSLLIPPAKADRKTLIIADDHPIFLDGLTRLLAPNFHVVSTVGDGQALVDAACELRPDAVIIDYLMPKLDGLEALKEIRMAGVDSKAIFLTVHEDPTYAVKCLEAGADGYIMKSEAPSRIVRAVSEILAGHRWVSPLIEADVDALMAGDGDLLTVEPESDVVKSLTPRQREIVRLLCSGEAAKRVGATLGVSRKTVEYHKYRLMRRLGYTTTAEFIRFAVRWRLDSEGTSLQG